MNEWNETTQEILQGLYALIQKLYTLKMSYWYLMNSNFFSTILHFQLYHVSPFENSP